MIEIVDIDNPEKWDRIIHSFKEYDVYYLIGYVKAFQIHGDGSPILVYYYSDDLKGVCVYFKRVIDDLYVDLITPYGYGGFIFEGDVSIVNVKKFYDEYIAFMQSRNIVSAFVRYHPILKNANFFREVSTVVDLGCTIDISLESKEIIWENIKSKDRNVIRRAENSNVVISHGKDPALFENFMTIYNATMDKDRAIPYYYFEKEFYDSIAVDLVNNYEIFYASFEGKIVSMAIIIFANSKMHYHLACSDVNYRHLASSNLLLYKIACWGVEQGFKIFHLGGGVGANEDGLFRFKKAFNKNSNNTFSIGKQIFNQHVYNLLVNKKVEDKIDFDLNSDFFPLYRL